MERPRLEIYTEPIDDMAVFELDGGRELPQDSTTRVEIIGRAATAMSRGIEEVDGMLLIFPTNRAKGRQITRSDHNPSSPAS